TLVCICFRYSCHGGVLTARDGTSTGCGGLTTDATAAGAASRSMRRYRAYCALGSARCSAASRIVAQTCLQRAKSVKYAQVQETRRLSRPRGSRWYLTRTEYSSEPLTVA